MFTMTKLYLCGVDQNNVLTNISIQTAWIHGDQNEMLERTDFTVWFSYTAPQVHKNQSNTHEQFMAKELYGSNSFFQ